MTASGGRLALRPELCDRCGRCVQACPQGKLRVGAGYIYVDVSECTSCFACVEACKRGAIARAGVARPTVPGAVVAATGPSGKVVVGSRAEAKALRKQQAAAVKTAGKGAGGKSAAAPGTAASEANVPSTAGETRAARHVVSREVVFGPVRWGAVDALAVAAALALTLLLKQLVLGLPAIELMPPSGVVAVRAGVLAIFYAAQLGLLAWLARRHGVEMLRAFRLRVDGASAREIAASVGLVAALFVGTRVVSTLWGALAQSAGWAPPASEALTGVFGGGGAGLALAVLMVVVVGPVTEELAFRGVIASAFASRFGLWPAVLVSAAIFSAYHLTAWVALPTFALGCALAWLALTRKTLWPAITLHVLYNGVVVAAAFWVPGG